MTAQEASNRAVRPWRALRRLSDRTSLRTKLITALLALVIFALAAMGIAGVSLLRGYLIGPVDNALRNVTLQNTAIQAVSDELNGAPPPTPTQARLAAAGYAVLWLPTNGSLEQIVQPSSAFMGGATQESDLPTSSVAAIQPWLTANTEAPKTVPGAASGDRWRVISVPQPGGTVVIGTDVSSLYTTIGQLAGVDLIVSVVIVFVLAIVGFAVVQANLRPLVDIEETAGEIADGHLNRRVPERDPRTEIGRLGRSLNTMLSQIETAFHAREQSEAAAHQSEERMRRFIADASHELRTPLTAIRGFAEYYRQRGGLVRRWDRDQSPEATGAGSAATGLTPDDLDRIMQRVEKEAARMGVLVEDLLLLARLDQQRPLARQPVDLLVLAADAVHDARLLAPSRTIELSVQPGAAFLVVGDEARLRQVIGNLMSNALTHTPDGTPIEVSVSSGTLDPQAGDDTPSVILDVTDHGPGMTQDQAHRAFERFYRADRARARTTGGSGLGLAIVRSLVAAQGGVTSVRTAEGEGATFRIALPLDPEAQGHADDADQADDPELDDETDGTGAADELPHGLRQ